MTLVVEYAPTDTQAATKKHAFWTALDWVIKEVLGHELVCVNGRQRAHWTEGRGKAWVRNVMFLVSTAEILSTITVSESFHCLLIIGLHY